MNVIGFLLFLVVGCLVIYAIIKLWGAYHGSRHLREFRRLGFVDAGRAPANEGVVTLVGQVEAKAPLTAPFSGRHCIGYAVDVFDAGQDVEGFDGGPPVFSAYGATDFTLLTGAERVGVSPADDVLLLLAPREDPTFVTEDNLAQYLPSFERIGLTGVTASRELRVRERLVLPGDHVAVRGEARRVAGEKRLAPAPEQPLLLMRGDPEAIARDITFSDSPIMERVRQAK